MNIRLYLLYVCFLLISFTAFAQPGQYQKIYSQYKSETKNLKEDTNKVLRYLEFAKFAEPLDTAVAAINQAQELSKELHYHRGIELSISLRVQKVYAQYNKETKNLKEDTNKVFHYLKFAGILDLSPDAALAILKKAKELSNKLNYQRGIELSIFQEGMTSADNKDYPSAIRYFRKAAKTAESHKWYTDVYAIYNSSLNIIVVR